MSNELNRRLRRIQPAIHGLAVGMTLGLGTMFLGQGCSAAGQCAACGACVPRLAILTLPLLADGAAILTGRVWSSLKDRKQDGVEEINSSPSAIDAIEAEDQVPLAIGNLRLEDAADTSKPYSQSH